MYGSKHHLYCNDCWKIKKKKIGYIPENKYGHPIKLPRMNKKKNKRCIWLNVK